MKMKKWIAFVLGICLIGTLIGCGGKEQGSKESAQLETVTIVLDWTPNTNHTGLYAALANGYFEEAGLDVKIIQPPQDGATVLVASGDAQFGIDFQEYMAPAFATEEPMPITAVAAIIQHNTSGFISLKEKGIAGPKDMAGHTYATWDMDVEKAILKYIMEKDGGDYSALNMVPSTVSDVVTALQTDMDLVWIYYAWDGIATKLAGLETNYINLADVEEVLDFYSPVIIANNDYLSNNSEQAKAFLAAVKKGYEFAIENPKDAAKILCDAAPELDENLVLESQKWLADQYQDDAKNWGTIDAARWDRFYNWLYDQGVITTKIPDGFGFSNDYLE
ncbi:ABC transporter substrate-binding protein [Lachnospiraceae bacterium ZAX-1]